MSDYHIKIFYSDEDEAYVADIPDLQHCSALADTTEEGITRSFRSKESMVRIR